MGIRIHAVSQASQTPSQLKLLQLQLHLQLDCRNWELALSANLDRAGCSPSVDSLQFLWLGASQSVNLKKVSTLAGA